MSTNISSNKIKTLSFKKSISFCMLMCLLFAESFTLTGCGKGEGVDIPSLDEPAAATYAFRPASKRRIGNVEILMGTVTPASYPCTTEKTVTIADIDVELGQYVKAGDVVAHGDTAGYLEELEELNGRIEELKESRALKNEVSAWQIKKLCYQREWCEKNKDAMGARNADREIAMEKENTRYDLSVIDNDISTTEKSIADINEEMSRLTFTAPHDGFVSYVAPVDESCVINPGDNIVVISDENELYIEVSDVAANDYQYKNYKSKWAYIDGKEVPITEYEFSSEELETAKGKGVYPSMRFVAGNVNKIENKDGDEKDYGSTEGKDDDATEAAGLEGKISNKRNDVELTPGMVIPIYFVKGEYRECLSVGNDSLYRDDDVAYVYVKGENGELSQRTVTVGDTDLYYSEIREGLNEGEEVFYENNALMPVSYSEAAVKVSDYNVELSSEYYETALTKYSIYMSPCTGVIDKESLIKVGDEVQTGDKLMGISTVTGKAELYEAKTAVDNLESRHNMAEEIYMNQRKMLDDEIMELSNVKDVNEVGESKGIVKDNSIIGFSEFVKTDGENGDNIADENWNNGVYSSVSEDNTINDENKVKDNNKSNNENEIIDDNKNNDSNEVDIDVLDSTVTDQDEKIENSNIDNNDSNNNDLSYQKGILLCERNILDIERKYENSEYERNKRILTKRYKELSGTSGATYIKALTSGVMGPVFSETGGAVTKGSVLTVTSSASDNIILVKMKSSAGNADAAGRRAAYVGQQVDIKCGDKTIKGECVGEREGSSSSQFYVSLKDLNVPDISEGNVLISFLADNMPSVVTVPQKAVYTETDSLTQKKSYYVWRAEGGTPVKEYVTVWEEAAKGENVVILNGLKDGDIVLVE